MKRFFITTLFSFFLLFANLLIAQNNEVCGFIKHHFNKSPVANVKLYIENSIATTITDEAGAFCINLTEGENKIIFEREGYFKTYTVCKIGDFLSIEMIKSSEQDLAMSKGLSIENIETLNNPTGRKVNQRNLPKSVVKISEEESIDLPARAHPEVSTMSYSSASKASAPRGPLGGAGATGAAALERKRIETVVSSKVSGLKTKGLRTDAGDFARRKKRGGEAPRANTTDEIQQQIKAGRLTAGEINDFSKWELWNDINENELSQYKEVWSFYPKERYAVQAVTEQGFPIVDATVALNIDGETTWTAKTDNTGKAELWHMLFDKNKASKKEKINLKASIKYKGVENNLPQLKRFEEGVNVITFKEDCNYAKNVDIAFVVDATGSMGDEIDFLKVELLDVVDRIQTEFEDLQIRLGNVFYRDKTDAYLTKNSPLTKNIKAGVAFIKDQGAGGGGDFPEAVDAGLDEAVNELQWSNEAIARILFLVLDAPPHQNEDVNKSLQQTISTAAQKGIRIVPIVGSGVDKSTEYLLRSCALATNGHYLFLTDHSGIGGSHLKPSTDSYEVKNLNDLLVDLIKRYVQVPNCNAKDEPITIGPKPNDDVSISPNPNDGRFLIESTTDLNELFITDGNGKILIRFTDFVTGQNQVDIANFPTGTYYVRYEQEGKVVSQKVVKR